MNITTEQLAELLAGIARSQQTIIDAMESNTGGWRGTHLLPKLNTAANMRIANVRLLDLPSRILLRSQSRVPMDVATIARDLAIALATPGAAAAPNTPAGSPPPSPAAPLSASATQSADENLNFFDT